MKNIHVLPTDKPSRLLKSDFKITLLDIPSNEWKKPNINIYITSDEEIKEGDYVVQINFEKTNTQVIKCETEFQTKIANSKDGSFTKNKIILTTDQDLIEDGVQAIDDEFLEWFVKNPSCEFVEVTEYLDSGFSYGYKIIIPKEEPKQETLEEFIQRQLSLGKYQDQESAIKNSIELTAKWQQEQDKNKYSEEDLKQFAFECVANFLSNRENKVEIELVNVISDRNNELFEQFKKK